MNHLSMQVLARRARSNRVALPPGGLLMDRIFCWNLLLRVGNSWIPELAKIALGQVQWGEVLLH